MVVYSNALIRWIISLSIKRTIGFMFNGSQCKLFVTAFNVVKSIFITFFLSSGTSDLVELLFAPVFAHTMHIMLPKNGWLINSNDWQLFEFKLMLVT